MQRSKAVLQWANSCFGVDLQGDRAFTVQAERVRGHVKWKAVDVSEAAAQARSRRASPVVGCLGPRESLTRRLEAPFASARKAGRVFPTLLDIQLPFDLDDCVYEFLDVEPTGSRTVRSVAVAARRSDVEQRLAAYGRAGLDPSVLDQEGLAIWTQGLVECPMEAGEEDGLRVVVNLAGAQSTLAVGRGGQFLNAHAVRAGDMAQFSRLLRAALEQPEAAKPAEGSAPEQPAVRCCWAGPDARDGALLSGMRSALERDWPGAKSDVCDAPETFLARAVATRALVAGALRCNLRAGPFVHPSIAARARRAQAAAALILLATGLFLCAGATALRVLAHQREAQVDEAVGVLTDRLAGYHVAAKGQDALKVCSEAVQRRIQSAAPFRAALEPSLVSLIAQIADMGGKQGLRYENLTLTADKVQIAGAGRDWRSAEPLLVMIKGHGYDAVLERKEALEDQTIPFSIASRGGP